MLKNFIASELKRHFTFEPTKGQEKLMEALSNFVLSQNQEEIFLIRGYAGTGKTTLVNTLVKTLNSLKINVVLLAPTGRAAKVIKYYTQKDAFTIHKWIYRQLSSKDGLGRFVLNRNLLSNTIFVVDEASMISNQSFENSVFGSGRLLDDLLQFVFNEKHCKLILIGDSAQLPPVGLSISPALDKDELRTYGKEVFSEFLTEVVRQAENSGILFNATGIRNKLKIRDFTIPKIILENFDDIQKISGEDLIEEISSAYDRYGMQDTIVVTRSNKRANRYNQGIRNAILYREEKISVSDLLMVVKNNYFWQEEAKQTGFIANGDIIELLRIKSYEERYGFQFVDVTIRLDAQEEQELDVKIMLDILDIETPSLPNEKHKKLYQAVAEDYAHLGRAKMIKQVKKDPFFNALQVRFAYAVTCHKAQGGQWKTVFVDQGFFVEERIDIEYFRWLYTAFTRASEKLFLVNFPAKFFDEN